MKTKQELENIKEEIEKLNSEMQELTDDELEQVTGGTYADELKAKVESGYESELTSWNFGVKPYGKEHTHEN